MFCWSSIGKNVQYKAYLSLFSFDVRDSAAVVYGPTFRCPSMSGPPAAPNTLSMVCSLQPLFSQERYTHRWNDPVLCYRYPELFCVTSHHITSHHITSHRISSHHTTHHHITSPKITSHHNTSLFCKICTQGKKTSLCIHSREKKKHFLESR
jgi:hypothetical protein